MKSTDIHRYKTETVCVQAGTRKDTTFNAVAVPIYATSTFAFEAPGKTKGYDYSRTANPTRSALEECLAALEGGARASATATGMAAETTVLHLLPAALFLRMKSSRPRKFDVRPLLERGESPIGAIDVAVATLAPGQRLTVIAPFLPSPQIERLRSQGFSARPVRSSDGTWTVDFSRD